MEQHLINGSDALGSRQELDVANVPQETLLAACEAIDKVHPHDGDDTKNRDDAENNRDEDKTEHFTVLLSGMKNLC